MRSSALNLLCGPNGGPLDLSCFHEEVGQIIEGKLEDTDGEWFPIIDGVPCFLRGTIRPDHRRFAEKYGLALADTAQLGDAAEEQQKKTNLSFSDKWRRFREYGLDPNHQAFLFDWYRKKFGLKSLEDLKEFYRCREQILEVGPGSGFNSRFMAETTAGQVYALDISDAAYTTYENTRYLSNCHVIQADLMDVPFPDNSFDLIIADGVLHHTPNTQRAVVSLYRKLRPGGMFYFYLYRKMGPLRQFCDQYIREQFGQLLPEECDEACVPITELGRELSHLNAKVTLKSPIPVLGIPAGTHDVQRLFYYSFLKCFWNEAFDFETNNMVNFDWYHPHTAWQHTQEEVTEWLQVLGVESYDFHDANPNGISVLLTKPPS